MKARPEAARPKHRRAGLLVAMALGVLAAGAWGYQQFTAAAKRADARADLLTHIQREVTAARPDGSELSRLFVRLQTLPDHETARDLLAAAARIELARDRPERALAVFGNRASDPGATPAEQGLGAEILLRVQESGSQDAASAGMLRQAATFARAAHDASGDPVDLFRAWQAATRSGDDPQAKEIAALLSERHADSTVARFVRLAANFDPQEAAPLASLRAEFARVPVELDALHVLSVLQTADLDAAVAAADGLLARGAGVPGARWAVALVYHACAMTHGPGSTDRANWIARRDNQLDWLLVHARPDDARRATWNELRNRR